MITFAEALEEKIGEMDSSEVRRVAMKLAHEADALYCALQSVKVLIFVTWMMIIIWR